MPTVVYGDFTWDDVKALENARKHGVTFEEAATIFDDPRAIDAPDKLVSGRLVLIGRSSRVRILFVVHAQIEESGVRIISARKASPSQRRLYEEG